jgi:hypothetical protein
MPVYVDDMWRYAMGRFRGMRMSHMIADTNEELHAMARKLGLKRKWFQHSDHYDISLGVRKKAVKLGAIEIELRTLAVMAANKRAGWPMGTPDTCIAISQERTAYRQLLAELLGS